VVVWVLLDVFEHVVQNRTDHGQQHCYHRVPTENQRLLLLLQIMGS
jgi:hypothetical protein